MTRTVLLNRRILSRKLKKMAYSFSVLLRKSAKSNLKLFYESLMYCLSVTSFKTCFITLQHSRLQFKPSIPPLFLVNVGAIHACTDRAREIAEVYGARDSFPIPLYIISGVGMGR